ncbi:hypothetical protein FN846DRAFT_910183 [Sphaerosporella brunnea]|uniref:Uncharacterized protein n=1 Tax=Sphaerosporella brunnea TaxID=1250544 RepID=A0A5J5EP36_9PEZI|nr:hypothetical protein FN846DRAFT_910183 [Sphaerosporella brunnea]
MDPSPSLGNRRRSLRTLRTNPERLAECGHDMMYIDPSSDRDLKCDICWRNRETLIALLLAPFERALRVEPEDLQRILREEQAERERKEEEERKVKEKREDERRKKEEESKRKRERMRAMQEARRGKGGKFEKKPKATDAAAAAAPPVAATTAATPATATSPGRTGTPGKRRGDDGKFLKSSSVESRTPSMTPSFTQSFTPAMSDASAADMRMRDSFSQARDPPIKLEETPFDFSFVPPEKFQAAVAEEKPRSSRPMPEFTTTTTTTIAPPERQITQKPVMPPANESVPQRDEEKVQPPPPAPIPKPKVFTFVAEHTSAVQPAGFYAPQPTARAPGESRPKPTDAASSTKRLRSRSRTSSIAVPPPAPSQALPARPADDALDSIRLQSPPAPATSRRSVSSTGSAKPPTSPGKPKGPSKQIKSKPRQLSTVATVTPAPAAPQQLRFVHTTAPASHKAAVPDKPAGATAAQQAKKQGTLFSFFRPTSQPSSGSESPIATVTTTAISTPIGASATSNPVITFASADRDVKRSLRGREATRQPQREEDPNRRKSTRSTATAGRVNYCESTDDDDEEDEVSV